MPWVRPVTDVSGTDPWLPGWEDSNLRMVESKSARILNDFNGFSDETAGSVPRYINRLETQSEIYEPIETDIR